MAIPVATASGEIRRGKLYLTDRVAFDENIATFKDGTPIELEIYRLSATRSTNLNRYYWGVIIKRLCDHTGYTPTELHELMKAKFLPKKYGFEGNFRPEEYTIGGSTRELDSSQFVAYNDEIRRWAAESLGLNIPAPNEPDFQVAV